MIAIPIVHLGQLQTEDQFYGHHQEDYPTGDPETVHGHPEYPHEIVPDEHEDQQEDRGDQNRLVGI